VNGLSLSKEYFFSAAMPEISTRFPELLPDLAAGLAGNGSECFGYDDMISRDHDWGVDFFLWLPDDKADMIPEIAAWKSDLLDRRPPAFPRTRSEYGARIGVETVGSFYKSLTGCAGGPSTLNEWVNVPEANVAMAVNGEVFIDNDGTFSAVRASILDYMPEDLRLKRLSYECMMLAQSGQYNFERSMKRFDIQTARTTLARFTHAAAHAVFLLNRRFMPYYKWRARMLAELPILGAAVSAEMDTIARLPLPDGEQQAREAISHVCSLVAERLREERLSETDDWFLTTQGEELRSRITNDKLRALPAQYEI